jgi:hypothetical protein
MGLTKVLEVAGDDVVGTGGVGAFVEAVVRLVAGDL